MIHFSLFSGIGGFELAAEWMGWRNYLSCEINEFGNKVREYYWPNAYHHKDIHTLNYASINEQLSTRYGLGWRDDDIILTGGFPCQPYSAAGKRLGKEDSRHLWPEMLRVISEVAPTYIVGENVYGLTNWNGGVVFEEVCADMENLGYEVQPVLLPASGIGAPHHRMRVWFVAKNTFSNGCLLGEFEQERTKVWRFGNTCTGSADRVHLSKGDAPHPNSTRCENWDKQHRGQQTQDGEGKRCTCGYCIRIDQSNAPHPNGNGLNGSNCEYEVNASERGEYAQRNFEQMGRDDSNPNGIGLRRESNGFGESRFIGKNEPPTYWQNFPTQSPICSGDDGISRKLDGITFSKWRNESIKAYGNAVVPQLVYQIFKSIEQCRPPLTSPSTHGKTTP